MSIWTQTRVQRFGVRHAPGDDGRRDRGSRWRSCGVVRAGPEDPCSPCLGPLPPSLRPSITGPLVDATIWANERREKTTVPVWLESGRSVGAPTAERRGARAARSPAKTRRGATPTAAEFTLAASRHHRQGAFRPHPAAAASPSSSVGGESPPRGSHLTASTPAFDVN